MTEGARIMDRKYVLCEVTLRNHVSNALFPNYLTVAYRSF